jgi:hypothetical protein
MVFELQNELKEGVRIMKATKNIIERQSSVLKKEASTKEIITGTKAMANQKYRILTEDEILRLRRHKGFYWSKRMKKESNLLYRLRYSEGKITQSFIEGVIESLESVGDFQITSFGHSKFILFIAGNQPHIKTNTSRSYQTIISHQYDKAVKRLSKKFEAVQFPQAIFSYIYSRSRNKVILSEPQRNTLIATLKPKRCLGLDVEETNRIPRRSISAEK